MKFIHKSICLPGFIPQIQQLQHDSFKRAFLIQPPGFHTVFRIEADIHRAFYLTVGPSGSLPDILVHREGRNSESGTDIRGGTLFILHDFNVLQETKLAEQHGKHIHTVCAGQKLIPHQEKSTAALAGNHGVHHLEDSTFRGGRCDSPDGIRMDGRSVPGMGSNFGNFSQEQACVAAAGEDQKIRRTIIAFLPQLPEGVCHKGRQCRSAF